MSGFVGSSAPNTDLIVDHKDTLPSRACISIHSFGVRIA